MSDTHATDEKLTTLNVQDQYKLLSVELIQEFQKITRLPYAIALINTKGDLNIGMTIRTACLLGAERVYLFGKRTFDRRTAVGAHHYIDVQRIAAMSDEADAVDMTIVRTRLAADWYHPIFFEQHSNAISLHDMAPLKKMDHFLPSTFKPVLVFGPEEGGGFTDQLRSSDIIVELPQFGVLRSYNVSQAAAIAMYALVFGHA